MTIGLCEDCCGCYDCMMIRREFRLSPKVIVTTSYIDKGDEITLFIDIGHEFTEDEVEINSSIDKVSPHYVRELIRTLTHLFREIEKGKRIEKSLDTYYPKTLCGLML